MSNIAYFYQNCLNIHLYRINAVPSEGKFFWTHTERLNKNRLLEFPPAQKVTKELLNVSILYKSDDKANLVIAETLYIHQFKPNINTQRKFCHDALNLF